MVIEKEIQARNFSSLDSFCLLTAIYISEHHTEEGAMSHHVHLTLREREDIMMMRRDGKGVCEIARRIGRDRQVHRLAGALAQLVRAPLPRVDGSEALLRAPARVPQARDTRRRVRARAGRGQVPQRAVVARADRGQARARAGLQPRERHHHLSRDTVGALRRAHRRPQGGQEAAPPRRLGEAGQDQVLAPG